MATAMQHRICVTHNHVECKWGGPVNAKRRRKCVTAAAASGEGANGSHGDQPIIGNSDPTISKAVAKVSGRSFLCTQCGRCCTMAADAEVWVSDADMSRITAYLGISQDELARRYLKPHARVPGWRLLSSKHIPAEQAGPAAAAAAGGAAGPLHEVCVFLDASGGCSVYGARPLQCSTFPWWPEMLGPEGWIQEPGYECEGLDHPDAPPLDTWAAVRALQQATAADAALQAAKPPGWSVDELYSAVEAGASPLPSHDSG